MSNRRIRNVISGTCASVMTVLILALAVVGCEREDLGYNQAKAQDPPSDEDYEHAVVPSRNDSIVALARLVSGEWKGEAQTAFYNDYGVAERHTFTTQLLFQLFEEGAVNGKGSETDVENGRQVFKMSFTWWIDTKGRLNMKYADGHQMMSVFFRVDSNTFTGQLVSDDALEKEEFTLMRQSS